MMGVIGVLTLLLFILIICMLGYLFAFIKSMEQLSCDFIKVGVELAIIEEYIRDISNALETMAYEEEEV